MRRHHCMFVTVALIVSVARGAWGQCCGDCDGNGVVNINELVTAVNRALQSCLDDGVCDASVATCAAQLGECQDDLADCRAQSGPGALPASGQTTAYGPGSDGDLQKGAARSFTDNGDGTITDNTTGLMWEKKSDDGSIHDKDNTDTWGLDVSPYTMNGTMVTRFLAGLNGGDGFAGYTDWRIPNRFELESLENLQNVSPATYSAFNTGCAATCTVTTCSCTQSDYYWSSTTYQNYPVYAWAVNFNVGSVDAPTKSISYYVRAVRGGS